jgi:hypothetical protein
MENSRKRQRGKKHLLMGYLMWDEGEKAPWSSRSWWLKRENNGGNEPNRGNSYLLGCLWACHNEMPHTTVMYQSKCLKIKKSTWWL